MNRAQLIEALQKTLGKGTSKAAADRSLTAVIDAIKTGVRKKGGVQLIGFGTFKTVTRKARNGRNPKTGETIRIKASKTVKFSPGSEFKKGL
jgi:DNA-binding protein HU-beta